MGFLRENLKEIATALVALIVLYKLWSWMTSSRRSRQGLRVYCRHCNWEGSVQVSQWTCQKCGSQDLAAV